MAKKTMKLVRGDETAEEKSVLENNPLALHYSKGLRKWAITTGDESFWGPYPVDALRKMRETLSARGVEQTNG